MQSITFDDAFNLLTCLANPSIDIATIWNANMNSFAAGIIGRKGNIAAQLKRAGAGTGTGAENLLHGDGPVSSDARPLALAAHAEAPNSEGAAGRAADGMQLLQVQDGSAGSDGKHAEENEQLRSAVQDLQREVQ